MKRFRFSDNFRLILITCLVTVISGAVASLSAQERYLKKPLQDGHRVEKKPGRHHGRGGNNIGGIIGKFGPLVIQGLQEAKQAEEEERRRRRKRKRVLKTPEEPKPRRSRHVRTFTPRIAEIPPLPVIPPDRHPPQLIADTPSLPLRRASVVSEPPEFRESEVVLLIRGDDPDATATDIEEEADLVLQDSISLTLLNGANIYRFGIPDARSVDAVLAQIDGTPNVELAVPNTYYRLQGETADNTYDNTYAQQYALPKMHIPDTQRLVKGNGITVAVIDSAGDMEHPVLRNANITELNTLKQGISEPHEHGTAITGLITASGDMVGIAPKARIISVRAFASEHLGAPPVTTAYALADAVDKAFVEGARIFNMSFAGAKNELFINTIDDAYQKGAVFVAAAGNEGPDAPPAYPAAHDKVIAITATDEADVVFEGANRGGYVLAAAPGVEIFAPVTNNGFDFLSGTSFAAAHVTGVIALLMEKNPKLTAEDIRKVLVNAAQDLGPDGRDSDYGAGLTNAYNALELVSQLQ